MENQPNPGGIRNLLWMGGPSLDTSVCIPKLSPAQGPHQHPSRNWKYGLGFEHGCQFTPLFLQTNLLVS